MSLSRRQFLSAMGASVTLLAARPLWASDPFAEFEAMKKANFDEYEGMVQESFAELDRMTQAAFASARTKVEREWGYYEAKLPAPKQWVGYDDRSKGRVVVDYEKKVLRVEAPAPKNMDSRRDEEFIGRLGAQILSKRAQEQDKMDPVRTEIPRLQPQKPKSRPEEELVDVGKLLLPEKQRKTPQALKDVLKKKGTVARRPVRTATEAKEVVSVEIPFDPSSERLSAKLLAQPVSNYSRKFRVKSDLILSVIENESSFNPRAISPIPAYGLMQLVPKSGGADAYEFVYGKKRIVDMNYLFDPMKNVELGSAYLHLLYFRYFKRITDERSRLYCSIAGYNTGPGNVSRALTKTTSLKKLAQKANTMSSQQVYDSLCVDLPYAETRKYLVKVSSAMPKYQ